jgi:hypothetical protein
MCDDSTMTPKQRVALELLDRAIEMYFAEAYFAAIHLAGAAEELFGGYLSLWKAAKPAADTIYDEAIKSLGYGQDEKVPAVLSKAVYRSIFHSRNRTKHLNRENDHEISFDPKREADTVLQRAMSNFLEVATELGIQPTRRMYRFYDKDDSD